MARNEAGQSRLPVVLMAAGGVVLVAALLFVLFGRDTDGGGGDEQEVASRCAFPSCRAAADPGHGRGYEGQSLAVNPQNPDHIVVTDANMASGHCTWHVTFDRGKEWTDGVFQEPEGYTGCHINAGAGGHVPTGPSGVAIGPSGTVYATYGSAHSPEHGTRESVMLATSTDGGKKFGTSTAALRPPGDDISYARPTLSVVAGPNGRDRLLLTFWLCRQGGRFCDSALFARSDDGGATFTPPITINDPPAGQTPSEALQTPDGTIYITFLRRYADGPSDLVLARSSDAGETYTYSIIDQQIAIGDRYDTAKLAFDPRSNTIYLAYSDQRTGSQQVVFRKSSDGGVTWANPVGIGPDQQASTTGSSRTPSLAVAPNGRIDVVYYRRPQPDTDNVFWAYSVDGGARFTNRQVNEQPIRRFDFNRFIGDWYAPDVVSLDEAAVVVWSDSRNAPEQDENTQDVFLRRMLPAGSDIPP